MWRQLMNCSSKENGVYKNFKNNILDPSCYYDHGILLQLTLCRRSSRGIYFVGISLLGRCFLFKQVHTKEEDGRITTQLSECCCIYVSLSKALQINKNISNYKAKPYFKYEDIN